MSKKRKVDEEGRIFQERFVNFRDNPLTLDVTLPVGKTKAEDDDEEEEGEEEEDDREMFGREFMQMYIREARKRSYAVLNMHRSSQSTD